MNGILESTEDVRWKIQKEFDDANFVLEPWIIDTFVSRKVGVDQCTCPQVSFKNIFYLFLIFYTYVFF